MEKFTSGSGWARSVPQQAAAPPRTVLQGPAGAEASLRPSLPRHKDGLQLIPRSAPQPAGTHGRLPPSDSGGSVGHHRRRRRGGEPCAERAGRHSEGRHSATARGAPYSGSFRRILQTSPRSAASSGRFRLNRSRKALPSFSAFRAVCGSEFCSSGWPLPAVKKQLKLLAPSCGRDMAAEESQYLLAQPTLDAYLRVQNKKLYLATFAAVLGPLSFGFVLGYSSPAIPELRKIGNPKLRLDSNQASWFGSVVTLGAAAGGILGGYLVDKIGRKLSLMLCALPYVSGYVVIISAQNIWMLYFGRILTGLASGITSLVVPVYISEISYTNVRGMLGSFVQLMVVTGILGAYIAGMTLTWYWLAVLCSFPPCIMLLFMLLMPETPRFLLDQKKHAEAIAALQFLRGPYVDHEWECRQIEASVQEEGLSLIEFKNPSVYRPLLIGVILMFLQQVTGINAVMFYAETIFEDANFQDSGMASVVVGSIQVCFTAVAALIVDKTGRKMLLYVSGIIMALSTALFGFYFKMVLPNGNNSSNADLWFTLNSVSPETETRLSWLAVVSLGLFVAGFALGWGPVPWLVMSEIFPLKVRGISSGACVLTNWIMAFLVTKEFHDFIHFLTSYGTFWLFSAFCCLSVTFTAFYVPETKGRTLEQIEAYFRKSQI